MTDLLDEICKDFAIVYADAERALNLLGDIEDKLKKITDTDSFFELDALRIGCKDLTWALLQELDSPFAQDILRRADKAIVREFEEEEEAIAITEEKSPPVPSEISRLLFELSRALGEKGIPAGHQLQQPKGLEKCLERILAIAQENRLKQERKDRILKESFRKIRLLALPLMRMALMTDSIDEDGNSNEDKDTLVEAGIEVLEQALRLTGDIEE